MSKIKYTDVVWDFNGTILDDVEAGILSVNKMLAERGLPTIRDAEHYRTLFRFPIIEYYRSLGFDFEAEPYEVLAPIWVTLYLENVKRSPLREGFVDAYEAFKRKGLRQHVLSATELTMLRTQLEELCILDKFDSVYGLDNIHAHSKERLAKSFAEEHVGTEILFIGDTEHDHASASLMGADCALVCGGHQPKEKLLSCKGAKIYSSLEELCKEIDSLC